MKITLTKCDFRFLLSPLFAMNAAAPGGAPPRWINNLARFGTMELPRRASEGP